MDVEAVDTRLLPWRRLRDTGVVERRTPFGRRTDVPLRLGPDAGLGDAFFRRLDGGVPVGHRLEAIPPLPEDTLGRPPFRRRETTDVFEEGRPPPVLEAIPT